MNNDIEQLERDIARLRLISVAAPTDSDYQAILQKIQTIERRIELLTAPELDSFILSEIAQHDAR